MCILIKNGKVFDVNKGFFTKNDILINGSKIEKIENGIVDNRVKKTINARDKYVFPGFIDAHSHISMWTDTPHGNDANECTNPSTPLIRAVDSLNPFDKSFKEALSSGFTTTLVVPGSGNVIGGQGAIIKNATSTITTMVVDPYACLKIAFGENPISVYGTQGKSPSCRMSTASFLNNEFTKAKYYKEQKEKGKIKTDEHWEVFLPVLEGTIPVKMHVHRTDDILTAVRFAEKFKLKYTLDHVSEGHLIKEDLKDVKAPMLIGPPMMFKSKKEVKNSSLDTAKILTGMGLEISIISDHPFANVLYVPAMIGQMVKRGLDYKEAIKMITINPAKALGISEKVGSLEVGKDADIVVIDGDPLEVRSVVEITIVDGKIVYEK